jgi:ATP/maltotriose-dependent transcriptional regulator MalT/DNA-binding SARP family transcriptional activator
MNIFDQVTRTKLILPRRRLELLSRERLIDLLYDLLNHKVVVISSAPGYGKTSLLIDLAHQLEFPVCWYAIDALDRDPRRFIAHFIASIVHRFPHFGQRSVAALQGTAQAGLDLDRLITTMVNEIHEQIREYFVLVLDDYHLVDGSQEISENCYLIISSRTLPEIPEVTLLAGHSQVGGVSDKELAFRADEIQALVLQNYQKTISEAEAEELVRETEGWITGLLLSSQIRWQGMTDRLRLARASGVDLYKYLAQQVLERQPAPVQDFLLRTSLMEEFDTELCQAVLGPAEYPGGESWSDLIETVLHDNLFVLPVGDENKWPVNGHGVWLRYHHLFQDFLQAQLAQERPLERECILRRLAAVYTERGAWEKAYELYRCLGDPVAMAELIKQAGLSLVRSGQLTTLAEWIDALPAEMLASCPYLLSLRGVAAVNLGDVKRGLSLQNQAIAACRATGDRAHLARALVWRAVDHRFQGKYRASLADADEALALAEQDESLGVIWAEALRARGICLYHMGQLTETIEWLEQSLEAYEALDEAQNVAILRLELGMAHSDAGHYGRALIHYKRALDYWQKTNNITWQANLLNNLGVLYHRQGDYEQAGATLEEALTCAEQSGYAHMETLVLASIGDLYADLEAPNAARDVYRRSREIARRIDKRFLLLYLDLAEAALARLEKDFAQARDLLDSAGRLAQESGSEYEQGLHQLEKGQLALAQNRAAEAVAHLEAAARCFDDGGQRIEEIRAYLYLAVTTQTGGQTQLALDYLEHVFRLVSGLENQHFLVVAGRQAKVLLGVAEKNLVLKHRSSRLLKQIVKFEGDIPDLRRRMRQQASVVPFAPPKLTIQALGRAQVSLDGDLVTCREWKSQRRVRDFLFCLLAHPYGLTREATGVIFWPDSGPSQLKLQFKNTIYRLRFALGKDIALFDGLGDYYRFNRDLDYEYDVEVFLRQMGRARAETDPHKRAESYRAAINLYQGPFLPEMDGDWVVAEREQLELTFIEANMQLGRLHLETEEYSLTLECSRRALAKDPYLEEGYRLAMRAYAAKGNRGAVARQYERCRQALLSGLNIPPSPQTIALYETLMR